MDALIESLPVLVLYPHSRCNCRCAMCDIWKVTDAQEIRAGDLERQMASIERLGVRWVVFSGGEPLMHSHLWRLAEMLRRRGVRLTLLSSGLLLGRHAGAIAKHIDDVIVSMDGPPAVHDRIRGVAGAFDRLARGVAAIRELDSAFPISARCTVQRGNFRHLADAVDAARGLELDSISFLAADLKSAAFNRAASWTEAKSSQVALSAEDVRGLEIEIEALIARGDSGGFVRESPEKLRRIARHFENHLSGAAGEAPRCNAPWVSAVVEADGTVRPCFFHRPIGHLGSGQTLHQILNGPEAIAFRAGLNVAENPVCRRCVCSLHRRESPGAEGSKERVYEMFTN